MNLFGVLHPHNFLGTRDKQTVSGKEANKEAEMLNRDSTFIVQFDLQQNMWQSRGI